MEFPPPPDLLELGLTPEANLPEFDETFEPTEPDYKGKLKWQAADGGSSTEPSTGQVKFSCWNDSFIFYSAIFKKNQQTSLFRH